MLNPETATAVTSGRVVTLTVADIRRDLTHADRNRHIPARGLYRLDDTRLATMVPITVIGDGYGYRCELLAPIVGEAEPVAYFVDVTFDEWHRFVATTRARFQDLIPGQDPLDA